MLEGNLDFLKDIKYENITTCAEVCFIIFVYDEILVVCLYSIEPYLLSVSEEDVGPQDDLDLIESQRRNAKSKHLVE